MNLVILLMVPHLVLKPVKLVLHLSLVLAVPLGPGSVLGEKQQEAQTAPQDKGILPVIVEVGEREPHPFTDEPAKGWPELGGAEFTEGAQRLREHRRPLFQLGKCLLVHLIGLLEFCNLLLCGTIALQIWRVVDPGLVRLSEACHLRLKHSNRIDLLHGATGC